MSAEGEQESLKKEEGSLGMQRILEKRARIFSAKEEAIENRELNQYVCFSLRGDERYGIEYDHVAEIINPPEIISVPCTPEFVAGVVNRRSDILTVLDLTHFFAIKRKEHDSLVKSWVIVVQVQNIVVGIKAEMVYGNETYHIEDISAPLASSGVATLDHVKGVIDGRVTLLDIDNILRSINPNIMDNK